MSFFSSIGSAIKKFTGGSLGGVIGGVLGQTGKPGNLAGNILGSVVGGIMTRKANQSAQQQVSSPNTGAGTTVSPIQTPEPDVGVRLQATADPNNRIPVVYGEAFLQGSLTDVEMTDNNTTMWYAITLCERTGNTILGVASHIMFRDIYWDNQRVVFDSDGVTIAYTVDENSKQNGSMAGLVEIYCYQNGSANQTNVEDFPIGPVDPAYNRFPSWTADDTMDSLAFLLVKVTYSPTKSITGLPPITAHLRNTMHEPGDCLFDYMTNTRYGAGIPAEEIFAQ